MFPHIFVLNAISLNIFSFCLQKKKKKERKYQVHSVCAAGQGPELNKLPHLLPPYKKKRAFGLMPLTK